MPDTVFAITVADAADAREIYDLQLTAYATESLLYDEPIPPVTQTWEDAAADFPKWRVLKLVKDDHIVGSVRVRIQAGACQIGRLMVLPAYRGRGYGSALLEAAERTFPGVPYELFTGDRSHANIAMYLRHGYTVIRTDDAQGLVFFRKNGQTAP